MILVECKKSVLRGCLVMAVAVGSWGVAVAQPGPRYAPGSAPSHPHYQSAPHPGSPYGGPVSGPPSSYYGPGPGVTSPYSGGPYSANPDSAPMRSRFAEPGAPVPSVPPGAIQRSYPGNPSAQSVPPGLVGPGSRQAMEPGRGIEPPDTSGMQQAIRQKDYDRIAREAQQARSRAENIERMSNELPVEDKLKLPLINHMYRQGADMMDEGQGAKDDSKIRMGIEKIGNANKRYDSLRQRVPQDGGNSGPNRNSAPNRKSGGGERQRGSSGGGNRR